MSDQHHLDTGETPAADQTPANGAVRFEFVQLQVSYYMAQMSIGDAKAAGILAFLMAFSGVTAERLSRAGASPESATAGLAAILVSAAACAVAFWVLWPRLTESGSQGNLFSWVSVSTRAPADHFALLGRATDDKLVRDVAEAMVDIAVIVRRKYTGVRRALLALAPATILHLISWYLS